MLQTLVFAFLSTTVKNTTYSTHFSKKNVFWITEWVFKSIVLSNVAQWLPPLASWILQISQTKLHTELLPLYFYTITAITATESISHWM